MEAKNSRLALFVAAAHVYLAGMLGWGVTRLVWGDRWWWLFLMNTFGVYLFLLLPLVAGLAWIARRRELWLGCGFAVVMGMMYYGGLFLPKSSPVQASSPTLSVQTFNMLGFNEHPEGVVAALRAGDADLVAIQELNPATAIAIEQDLRDLYPYQELDPQEGVTGMGVLSRYPLSPTGEILPGQWVGAPQILSLDFEGRSITILHFHPFPTLLGAPRQIELSARAREEQVRTVLDFIAHHPGPVIAPVDFNAGDQGRAYALLTEVLRDAWREAGWGMGHTFPGAVSPGSSRPVIAGIPVPSWLVRIDYIFYSEDFRALDARIGPWDGVSDHRSVLATLSWEN